MRDQTRRKNIRGESLHGEYGELAIAREIQARGCRGSRATHWQITVKSKSPSHRGCHGGCFRHWLGNVFGPAAVAGCSFSGRTTSRRNPSTAREKDRRAALCWSSAGHRVG